jgi:hypothetical protein
MSNAKRGRGRPLSPVTVELGKLKVGEELYIEGYSEPLTRLYVTRARKRFARTFVCQKVSRGVFKVIRERKRAA